MSLALLRAIRQRQKAAAGTARPGFGHGISTADTYVRTVRECVGSDLCYRYAATQTSSFEDVLRKASNTLVYSAPGMRAGEVQYHKAAKGSGLREVEGITLPKNTLMVFRHTLTSPREDRDGDILRSEGAKLDPKMLLLWQHMPTLPIGKLLRQEHQDQKSVEVTSCIVDMNDLCHDAAVMVDNDMGRFSHGFRALEFEEIQGTKGAPGGFDVKSYEVMEESLVSVPSNVDAQTQEVLLSLVEGGKLTSPLMKEYGRTIRGQRPARITVPGGMPGSKGEGDDDGTKKGKTGKTGKAGCTCGGKGAAGTTPEEAGAGAGGKGAAAGTGGKKRVKAKPKVCPTCGGALAADGRCGKCKAALTAVLRPRYGAEFVDESIQNVLQHASAGQRARLLDVLQSLAAVERADSEAEFFQAVMGGGGRQ